MKEPKISLYEGMYIISASLSSAARSKAIEKIKEGITMAGGELLKIHEMGKKRLAYEIKNQREGYYYLIYFNVRTDVISKLWAEYHLNEDLIRFMTIRVDSVPESFDQNVSQETSSVQS